MESNAKTKPDAPAMVSTYRVDDASVPVKAGKPARQYRADGASAPVARAKPDPLRRAVDEVMRESADVFAELAKR